MIKFVMNAFPRTGSTILYWMIKDGYPDGMHLYEPLHDKLFRLINEEGSVMHGGTLWDGYQNVPPKTLDRMWKKAKDCTLLFDFNYIKSYLDEVDSIDADVYLQPNRMHFILSDVAKTYDCQVAHLTRKPADCFIGLVEIFSMYGKDLEKNYNWWIENIVGFINFFENQYAGIADKFGAPKAYDFLDKWLCVYAYQNYYAARQADEENVTLILFEDLLDGKAVDKLESFTGMKLGARTILKPERMFLSSDAFKKEVDDRINALGLREKVDFIIETAAA